MRWLEPDLQIGPAVEFALAQEAVARRPDNPKNHVVFGDALSRIGRVAEAIIAYETAARQSSSDFHAWPKLARRYLDIGRPEAALDACYRGEAKGPSANLAYLRGRALHKLGRLSESEDALMAAVKSDGLHIDALKALLAAMAKRRDGEQLLEFCDGLSQAYKDTSIVRGHRAIALSLLGRIEEALQIVDLNRHVTRVTCAAPPGFDGIDEFNHRLADDILADKMPGRTRRANCDINYKPPLDSSETLRILRDLIKAAIEDYLSEAHGRGLDAIMPPPPAEATFFASCNVYRNDGHNGEHLHSRSYVSAVYYVLVPDSVIQSADNRGALALGSCTTYTGGYQPCWGIKYLKPIAGSLVIFPSHIYHDVVPSLAQEPRISVAADLRPIAFDRTGGDEP